MVIVIAYSCGYIVFHCVLNHDLVSHSAVDGLLGSFQFEDIINIMVFNNCDM